jgi:hypothetical protein
VKNDSYFYYCFFFVFFFALVAAVWQPWTNTRIYEKDFIR